MKLKVLIDEESCLAYGDCAEQAPGAFEVGDIARVVGGAPEQRLRDAARTCPAEAITLIDAETGETVEPSAAPARLRGRLSGAPVTLVR